MHKELPLYVFIRNTFILAILFFIISAVIIERSRSQKGENTLFNGMMLKQKNIMDYNDHDILNSLDLDPINALKEDMGKQHVIIPSEEPVFSTTVVENNQTKFLNKNEFDL